MRHTKRAAAMIFAAVIVFSSCALKEEKKPEKKSETAASQTETTTETEAETEPVTETEEQEEPGSDEEEDIGDRASLSMGYIQSGEINEAQTAELIKAAKALKPLESSGLTLIDGGDDLKLNIFTEDGSESYTRKLSDKGWVLIDTKLNCYEDSPELSALASKIIAGSREAVTSLDGDHYSIECEEPTTEAEYVSAAVKCCEAWFTSLQSEDTEEYYRNNGFKITEVEEESGHQKCNYLSCGMVDGVKEFVVEICFNAEDCGDNTFYDDYYQEGRYTEAGTFWSGNYICGRFKWQDGRCTLTQIGTRDQSESLQSGLNGIPDKDGYRNFFEFARRSDYKKAVEESFVPYGRCTVSANLTQTEDGKPINVDIYTNAYEETKDGFNAIWDERAYINGEATYSTGLYFTDNGTGHMPDTLPKQFDLTFDNYDGDANPDFCCRYDSDSEGTYYVLESVQTDGRIFNLSGRAFEGGIYIAGCTEPSPRLQRTANIPYIGWKKDESGYYPTDNNGTPTDLPDLNMYSDRFFLPDDLKLYSKDEDTVTCFLWNNTDSEVTTDTTYSIEMSENGKWKTVAKDLSCKSEKIEPRGYAEVSYDISSVKDRYNTVYRIVQKCGSREACGSFWLEGKEVVTIRVKAEPYLLGAASGSFSVEDNGFSETKIESAYITDGSTEYPLTIFPSDDTGFTFTAEKLPEKAGKYKLVVNGSAQCSIAFKDMTDDIPGIKAEHKIDGEDIKLSLTCSADAELINVVTFKDQGGRWSSVPFLPGDGAESYLKKNKKFGVTLQNFFDDYLEQFDLRDLYEEHMEELDDDEETDEELAALGIDRDTSFEEFEEKLTKAFSADPEADYLFVISYVVNDVKYQTYVFS